MVGLVRAPTRPQLEPPPAPPAPPPAPAPEQVASESRIAARQRSLRGRPGTIATSERGVLAPLPVVARKSLLGE